MAAAASLGEFRTENMEKEISAMAQILTSGLWRDAIAEPKTSQAKNDWKMPRKMTDTSIAALL